MSVTVRYRSCVIWTTRTHNPIFSLWKNDQKCLSLWGTGRVSDGIQWYTIASLVVEEWPEMSDTVRHRSCVRWNTMIHNPIFSCGRMTRNVCHCEVHVVCHMEYKDTQSHLKLWKNVQKCLSLWGTGRGSDGIQWYTISSLVVEEWQEKSVTVRYRSCVRWNTMIHSLIFSCERMTRNVCHCEIQVVWQMEYNDTQSHL
jgi:hypothetical protein